MTTASGGYQNSEDKPKDKSDESRRNLLKVGLGVSAALVIGGVGSIAKIFDKPWIPRNCRHEPDNHHDSRELAKRGPDNTATATPNFPVILLANLKACKLMSRCLSIIHWRKHQTFLSNWRSVARRGRPGERHRCIQSSVPASWLHSWVCGIRFCTVM